MEENKKFEMTDKERLSYILQLKTLELLEPSDSTYRNLRLALENGYEYNYLDFFDTFIQNRLSIKDCRFVLDVLEMYRGIIYSAMKLKCTNLDGYKFPGFDGNNERECKMLFYVNYYLIDLQRYTEIRDLSNDDFNSHKEMCKTYENRLLYWNKLDFEEKYSMPKEKIEEILKIW